ncbi:MAG: serine/threonine protein kinase [Sandaracinaceae bacterium]|nr:serine/threonine protein kinase [Sandaracinaceae bacterium]
MGRPSQDDVWIGKQIAERYRLDRVIGKGGMGTVYEAVHLWTSRPVAVKLLWTEESETMSKRILAEARAAAAVRHPNLVEVLDVGVVEYGLMYLVLELLEGESLHSHLKRRDKMRAEDALDVVVPILDALEALHRAHVVHRDVKPGNIFLSKDGTGRVVPKLLDLGISKRLDAEEALTVTGALMGTPSYMSPEQCRGAPEVGASADIWAIGVVLFECLTGKRPFDHASIPGLLHLIATERPPPVSSLVNDLPGGIAAAVDRALAYDAADRHASAGDMADALVNAALRSGWPLTCRIPAGPMISLVPEMPDFMLEGVDPEAMTPMSDPDATPFGVSMPTPLSPRVEKPPRTRESEPGKKAASVTGALVAPSTRDGEEEEGSEVASEAASASASASEPASASGSSEPASASSEPTSGSASASSEPTSGSASASSEPASASSEPASESESASETSMEATPEAVVLPTRRSPMAWIAVALLVVAGVGGVAYWQTTAGATAETTDAVATPPPEADPVEPTVEDPAPEPDPPPVAAAPAPDAGVVAVVPEPAAAIADPAPTHRDRPTHHPTESPTPITPRTPHDNTPAVQEGANRAPIILD